MAAKSQKSESSQTRFAKDQLKAFVERMERLSEEKKAISDDIRDVFAEARGNGFDVKALRAVIRLRAQDAAERAEHQAILDLYKSALGMLDGTPLGNAAIERATGKVTKFPAPTSVAAE